MTAAVAQQRSTAAEPPPSPASRDLHRWLLLGVLALAASVRLWGLGSQPILYFDSGVYLGEGSFLASAAQHAAAGLFSTQPGNPLQRLAAATQNGVDGHPPDIAKPGHAILLALAFLVLGKSVFAAGVVSALAGIGTVAVTYAIAARGWGARVAVVAATLLAISGQHLVYSREPLVEADGLFFATLASWLYLRAQGWRGLFAAGVLWGIAFSCNNRMSYLPAIFVIAELARWPGWRGLARRGVLIGIGCLVPLGLIEGAYLVARVIGRITSTPTNWLDYAQQLVAFTRMNPPDRIRYDEWPTYFVDVALMEGLAVLALLLVGIALLVWRLRSGQPTRTELLLAGSLLVPILLYSIYSTGEVRLRHFSLALPWGMLAAALALDWLCSKALAFWRDGGYARAHAWLVGGASVTMVLLAAPRVVALEAAPSGMPSILQAVGSSDVASSNGPVLSFYVGEARTNARLRQAFINVPGDLDTLGTRYPLLLVDMQASVFAGDLTEIYARARPLAAESNGSDAWYLADLLEHYGVPWGSWSQLLATWDANRADATQLRLYAMSDVIAARNAE